MTLRILTLSLISFYYSSSKTPPSCSMIHPFRAQTGRDSQLPRVNTRPLLPQIKGTTYACHASFSALLPGERSAAFEHEINMHCEPGTVLGTSDGGTARWTRRPCSKASHFKKGPEKTSQPRSKTGQRLHAVGSGRRSPGAVCLGTFYLCRVIRAPLGGSSLCNPFQYLVQVYFLLPHIWHDSPAPATRAGSHRPFF